MSTLSSAGKDAKNYSRFICAIDFGNDAVVAALTCVEQPTKVHLLVDEVSSKRFTKPVVSYTSSERVVGDLAANQPWSNRRNTFTDVLGIMQSDNPAVTVTNLPPLNSSSEIPAWQLLTLVFKTIRSNVKLQFTNWASPKDHGTPEEATNRVQYVLVLPTSFTKNQAQQMHDAAQLANLDVVACITAAASIASAWGTGHTKAPATLKKWATSVTVGENTAKEGTSSSETVGEEEKKEMEIESDDSKTADSKTASETPTMPLTLSTLKGGIRTSDTAKVVVSRVLFVDVGDKESSFSLCDYYKDFANEEGSLRGKLRFAVSSQFGSNDLDKVMYSYFVNEIITKTGSDHGLLKTVVQADDDDNEEQHRVPLPANIIKKECRAGAKLLKCCRKLKHLLSTLDESSVVLESLNPETCLDYKCSLTSAKLEDIVKTGMTKFETDLAQAWKNNTTSDDLTCNGAQVTVELIGGGSRSPLVKRAIQRSLKKVFTSTEGDIDLSFTLDSSACLAKGAAAHIASDLNRINFYNNEVLLKKKEVPDSDMQLACYLEQETQEDESNSLLYLNVTSACSSDEMTNFTKTEMILQKRDDNVRMCQNLVNGLEQFISENKGLVSDAMDIQESQNESSPLFLLNATESRKLLNEAEEWLEDLEEEEEEAAANNMETEENENGGKANRLRTKLEEIQNTWNTLNQVYLEKLKAVEAAKEEERRIEQEKALKEKQENPEENDHDTRKLSTAKRIKLLKQNKDEGTIAFKAKNYDLADTRYTRALQHAQKAIEFAQNTKITEEQQKELDTLRVALHMNRAVCMCLIRDTKDKEGKLDKKESERLLDSVFSQCESVLGINDTSVKALYRRAYVYEKRGKYDLAKKDLEKAAELDSTNKSVISLSKRVEKRISRQKAQRKKMAGKMFG
eukprot:g2062.t1